MAEKQPVIIKRVKKTAHAAHGGAWKIAYADFVTAMMAFFLLLWLLSAVTQEQLEGISTYFSPISVSETKSGAGGVLGGKTVTEEGAAESSTSRDSVTVDLPPPKAGTGGATASDSAAEESAQKEQEQMEEAKEELEQAIAAIPQLKQLADSLLIDTTPEGLRIQLLDKEGLAMFASGSARMYPHTRRLIELVSKVILKMPQQLSISGHTDSQRFVTKTGYSNWELSADRANAARRELIHFKVPYERVSRVVGKAATELFLPNDPTSARNRRLSIVLLRGTGAADPATAKKKKEEALPGLEKIRERQIGKEKAPPPKLETTGGEALPGLEKIRERQVEKKKAPPLKLETTGGEALPGLEAIRKRQAGDDAGRPAKTGKPDGKAAPAPKPAAKKTEPRPGLEEAHESLLKKQGPRIIIESTEGEALPGLDAIRKKQVEKTKTPPPVKPRLQLQPNIEAK